MADLFGIDIAGTVADALSAAGGLRAGTLTQDGEDYAFQGFVEIKSVASTDERLQEALVFQSKPVMAIVGASLPAGIEPRVNDEASMDGIDYILGEKVRVDPAGAVFEFQVG